MTFNETVLAHVVLAAKASVRARKFDSKKESRWLVAIDRAVEGLENNPWIALRSDGVLVWASETGADVYEVNGRCQCRAAQENQPCKHISAKRLLENYNKAMAFPVVPSRAEAQGLVNPAPACVSGIPGLVDAIRTGYTGDERAEWDEFAALAYQPTDGKYHWGTDERAAARPWVVRWNMDSAGNGEIRRFRYERTARRAFEQFRARAEAWSEDTSLDKFHSLRHHGKRGLGNPAPERHAPRIKAASRPMDLDSPIPQLSELQAALDSGEVALQYTDGLIAPFNARLGEWDVWVDAAPDAPASDCACTCTWRDDGHDGWWHVCDWCKAQSPVCACRCHGTRPFEIACVDCAQRHDAPASAPEPSEAEIAVTHATLDTYYDARQAGHTPEEAGEQADRVRKVLVEGAQPQSAPVQKRKASALKSAFDAPLVKWTVKGETWNGYDI